MKRLRARRADRIYAKGGWGPLESWPVERGDDPPLVFQMRLPLTMELVDINVLVDNAPAGASAVGFGAGKIDGFAETTGQVLSGALRETKADGSSEVLASMTVSFAPGSGLPAAEDAIGPDAAGDVRPPEVEQLSDQATRISRFKGVVPPGQEEAVPTLMIKYLIASRYGAIAWTFVTSGPEMVFGGGGRGLFGMIAETGYIGERPQSY